MKEPRKGLFYWVTFDNNYRCKAMLEQTVYLFIFSILLACNHTQPEKIYDKLQLDSIAVTKHRNELDSLLIEYAKSHPGSKLPVYKEQKYFAYKTVEYNEYTEDAIRIERLLYYNNCVERGFLYIQKDSVQQIIELPWYTMTDTTTRLVTFSRDYNKLTRLLRLKNPGSYRFRDEFLLDNLGLILIDSKPMLLAYENELRHIGGCEDLCTQNLKAIFNKVESIFDKREARVYTNWVNFIVAYVDEKDNSLVDFEIINPECSCRICM